MAYLFLERLALEADEVGDPFAEVIRDSLPLFWQALTSAEQHKLNHVTGRTMDAVNPTVIVSEGDRVSVTFGSPGRAASNSVADLSSINVLRAITTSLGAIASNDAPAHSELSAKPRRAASGR